MRWLAASYGNGYVSDIEIVWVLANLVGAWFSIRNVRAARLDVQDAATLPRLTNGRRRLAATSLRVELARLAIQGIFLAIGGFALALPAQETAALPLRYQLFGAVFRWGLIAASLLVTYQSIENWAMRRSLGPETHEGGTA